MNILNTVPLFGHTQIYLTSPPLLGAFRMFLCVRVFYYKNATQSTYSEIFVLLNMFIGQEKKK